MTQPDAAPIPFVSFADLMAKVGYLIFYWSKLEQEMTVSIAAARCRLNIEPTKIEGSVSARLQLWADLVARLPEHENQVDLIKEVQAQTLLLRKIRNLIVHGLEAGNSMPKNGKPFIRCAIGGYDYPTGDTVTYTLEDLEHFAQGLDACRRAFMGLDNFNYRVMAAAGVP